MRALGFVVVLSLASSVGCGERDKAESTSTREPRAAASAEEGAMCEEHGVLEALCTKCNPSLVAVFRAKGDWCAEHGFPESICPICHPERGGRPASDVARDDAPPDGTKVRFRSPEVARAAGIRTTAAVARSGSSTVGVPARIVYDATKLAHVNARTPGVVRVLHVDVGATVRRGAPLASLESAIVSADQSRSQAARERLATAQAAQERVASLHADGISADRDLLAAREALAAARAEVASVEASLGLVGATRSSNGRYTLVSPLAGVVTQRSATVGTLVGSEQMLFEVVDTSAMWAEIEVPEDLLGSIAVGQRATVSVDGLHGRTFGGQITYVAPAIDPHTRTVVARVPLENADGALRANMFAEAQVEAAATAHTVVVPRAAVQRARSAQLVFVRLSDDLYEARRVTLGTSNGDQIEVTRGVRPGEPVVVEGSFLLKTETLKESIGAGCCAEE